jgi:hypothetical protein
MNPSNVNYNTIKTAGAMKILENLKNQGVPVREQHRCHSPAATGSFRVRPVF